jgi:DNA-binding CsgD family transcriptional regulator
MSTLSPAGPFAGGDAVLSAVSKELSRALSDTDVDTNELLAAITTSLSQLVPGLWVAVLMNRDPSTSQVVMAHETLPAVAIWANRFVAAVYRPGQATTTGLSQRVIETGQPVVMPQMTFAEYTSVGTPEALDYLRSHPFPITADAVSVLVVPMRCLGAVIGTLGVFQYDSPAPFTENDLGWFQDVADRVAIAAELTQLHAHAIDRQERLTAIGNLGTAMRSSQDLRLTLELLLDHVTTTLKVDAADLLTVDESAKELVTTVKTGFHAASMPDYRFPIPPELTAAAAHGRGPENAAEMDWIGQYRRRSSFAREGFQAYRLAPLIIRNRLVGVIEIYHRSRLETDQEWLGFFDALASQAAIAIDNAGLREWLEAAGGGRPSRSPVPAPDLSRRERQILALVVEGATNQEIADKLHLSLNTIKFHVRQLLEKLSATNRTELATRATKHGWL